MIAVKDNSDPFIEDLIRAVSAGLGAAANQGAEYAAKSIPGAGASAKTGASGRLEYVASNPGSPPGDRRGGAGLKGSISSAKADVRGLTWRYGSNLKYGRHLEYGATTPGGQPFWKDEQGGLRFAKKSSPHAWRMAKTKPGRIAARPWLQPTLVNARVAMEKEFVRAARDRMARGITARLSVG